MTQFPDLTPYCAITWSRLLRVRLISHAPAMTLRGNGTEPYSKDSGRKTEALRYACAVPFWNHACESVSDLAGNGNKMADILTVGDLLWNNTYTRYNILSDLVTMYQRVIGKFDLLDLTVRRLARQHMRAWVWLKHCILELKYMAFYRIMSVGVHNRARGIEN
jgi:hypothetical protein